jgi:hypothetical protein
MEQTYRLGRKRIWAGNARRAKSAEPRLVTAGPAGRYSVNAAAAAPPKGSSNPCLRPEAGNGPLAERSGDRYGPGRCLANADRDARLRFAADAMGRS